MTDEIDVGTAPTEGTVTSNPGVTNSFADLLPEDLRVEPSLKDFKDVGSLAKSYVNAQRMIGSSVRIPSNDASKEVIDEFYKKITSVPGVMRAPDETNPESMEAFYRQLGRPDKPEDYKVEVPEGFQVDTDSYSEFTKLAHSLGLNNKQVEAIAKFDLERSMRAMDQTTNLRETAEETLKKNWGPEYQTRMSAAKEVVRIYSEKFPDAMQEVVNGPAGNNPAVIAMLAELGRHLSEKGVISQDASRRFGMSSDEAMDNIKEIHANKQHPYWNPQHPEHKAAREKVDKLYRIAYPD